MARTPRIGWILLPFALLCLTLIPSSYGQIRAEEEGCYCVGRVGNVDCDYRDEVTLSDILMLIDHLFISQARLPNLEEANCNGDPEGKITLGDVGALIDYFFISGRDLPLCPGEFNSPPSTRLARLYTGVEFINARTSGRDGTGVPAEWSASDVIDHPYDEIEYEFEYRLYGPYTDAEYEELVDSFVTPVFRMYDGRMFLMDNKVECDEHGENCHPTWVEVCDTSYDDGVRSIACDTILVDTLTMSNEYGVIDTLIRFEDDDFMNSVVFNRVAIQSEGDVDAWVNDNEAIFYNVFNDAPSDTTWKANFMVWVRAREKDAPKAVDMTPAFARCEVIDPHFEHDVLVVDYGSTADENTVPKANAKAYWADAVNAWIAGSGREGTIDFDIERDFWRVLAANGWADLLSRFLKYKVVIVHQDAAVASMWAKAPWSRETVYSAMNAGVNVWAATRVPMGNFTFGSPGDVESADEDYTHYFGLEEYTYTGWSSYTIIGGPRIEDFCGTLSPNEETWPAQAVDSARLHSNYRWEAGFFFPWDQGLAALPEVGWLQPSDDAEVLYLYKSIYGEEHAIYPDLSFQGNPVMIRLDREPFRSVQSLFTPISFEQTKAQVMVDSVLNWLYDGSTLSRITERQAYVPSLTREE